MSATAPLSYDAGTQTVSVSPNAITAASIANRARRVSFTGNQFLSQSSTSAFNLGNGTAAANRQVRVTSFAGADSAGTLTLTFVVPADYAGVSSGDLATNPGLQAPRLRIKWATDSTQPNGSRKVNMDVSFSQDDQLVANSLANRFRYNIRANAGSLTNAAESLDPTNTQIADQIVPEAGEIWDTSDSAVTAWAPGQVIVLTLARNVSVVADDPNSARAGIVSVSFEYDADQ